MADGNLNVLTESTAIIFRLLLGGVGIACGAAGAVIGSGQLPNVIAWLRSYLQDLQQFAHDLKPRSKGVMPGIVLLLVLICAAIIRVDRLNEEISHDEAYTYVVFSSTSVFNIITNYHLPNNHVLNSLIIDLSTHLFGNQPWAVRLPALLAGLLLITATYALARQLYDQYTGLLSAILVTILPGAIFYSARGRGYVLVSLFTMLSLLLANYIRKNNNLFAWSLLAVCCALGFYSVPVMLFPFGMIFAWLFFENIFDNDHRKDFKIIFIRNWIITGFITALLVLLLYTPIFIYSGIGSVFANQFVRSEPLAGFIRAIPNIAMTAWHDWTAGLPFIFTVVLLIGFCLGLLFHRKNAQNRFPLQLAAFVGIGVFMLIQRPINQSKVWAFLQAPFMVWCAAGIVGLIQIIPMKLSRKDTLAALTVTIALLATFASAASILPHISDHWVSKGPTENTALAIKNQISPGDLIIVDSPFDAAIWYYSRINGLPESDFYQSRPFNRLFIIISPGDGQTVQSVLLSRGPEADLADAKSAQKIFSFGFLDTYLALHR
jgi:hypothetical protein